MFSITKNNFNQRSCIAIKDIKKNTILFCEEIKNIVDKNENLWYEKILFYELQNNYEQFLDLMPVEFDKYIIKDGIFTKKYECNKKEILDLYYNKIIRNAFNVKINGINYATILYKGRLFNHSCDPNVKFNIVCDKNKYYMKFYVCKDIKKGEELFDNYFNTNLPYEKRQHIAQTYYGFACCCSKCKKN
jgi:hypothetical protein